MEHGKIEGRGREVWPVMDERSTTDEGEEAQGIHADGAERPAGPNEFRRVGLPGGRSFRPLWSSAQGLAGYFPAAL